MTAGPAGSLSVAVVGAGRMGAEHADAVRAAGDEVVAVVDADPAAREALARRHDAAALADLDELPARTRVAVVATPSAHHLAQAEQLVARGCAVLLEKPPWVHGQDPARLLRERGAVPVYVGMSTRFDPGVRAVRDAAVGGELGPLLRIQDEISFTLPDDGLPPWYHTPAGGGGGLLQTNGVHALDRIRWIAGPELQLVAGRPASTARDVRIEDQVSLVLRAGATLATVDLLWSRFAAPPSRLLVVGESGWACAHADGRWSITTADGTRNGSREPGYDAIHAQWRTVRSRILEGRDDPALAELRQLVPVMGLIEDALRAPDWTEGGTDG